MKKLKIITSLGSVAALSAAVPVVATSCSSSIKTMLLGQNNIAKSQTQVSFYVYLIKNGELQYLSNVKATSSDKNLLLASASGRGPIGAVTVTKGIKGQVGSHATITMQLTDINNNVTTQNVDFSIVEDSYGIKSQYVSGDLKQGSFINAAFEWLNAGNPESLDSSKFSVRGQIYKDGTEVTEKVTISSISSTSVQITATDDAPLGKYDLKLTVTDKTSSSTEYSATQSFNVVEANKIVVTPKENAAWSNVGKILTADVESGNDATATLSLTNAVANSTITVGSDYSSIYLPSGIEYDSEKNLLKVSKSAFGSQSSITLYATARDEFGDIIYQLRFTVEKKTS